MALVHPQSCPATKTELDLWWVPHTQTSINDRIELEYRPVAALNGESPLIEFLIPASADVLLDLHRTQLEVEMKVKLFQTAAGGAKQEVVINDDARDKFSPINNMLHSMFQRIDFEMNGKLVTPASQYYPFRAYMETLLNYDKNAMDTHLQSVGWKKDVDFGVSKDRCKQTIADDGTVLLEGGLCLDLFNQGRLMIGGIEMKLSLQANKPAFYFITSAAEYTVEVSWTQVALKLLGVKVAPPVLTILEKKLASKPAIYPITRTDVVEKVVPTGGSNVPIDNLWAGQLPRRMFMVMLENDAGNGTFTSNPFKFQHFKLNHVSCIMNGNSYPAQPLTPDFEKNRVWTEYLTLITSLKDNRPRPVLTVTPKEFVSGYTIFAWNFSPDFADGCDDHWNVTKRGSLRVDLRFKAALEKVISIFFIGEFDNIVEVDKDRNVFTDF